MKQLLLGAMILVGSVTLAGCTTSSGTSSDTAGGTNTTASASDLGTFAECLKGKGWKMFGTARCSHCKDQKSKFGDAFAKVDYIDCDVQKDLCTNAGIQGYPTWVDGQGKQYPGNQPLEQLATLSTCQLTQ